MGSGGQDLQTAITNLYYSITGENQIANVNGSNLVASIFNQNGQLKYVRFLLIGLTDPSLFKMQEEIIALGGEQETMLLSIHSLINVARTQD